MRFVAIAAATAVALLVAAAVLGSVAGDAGMLWGSAGWYGLAVFLGFPLLLAAAVWRNER